MMSEKNFVEKVPFGAWEEKYWVVGYREGVTYFICTARTLTEGRNLALRLKDYENNVVTGVLW